MLNWITNTLPAVLVFAAIFAAAFFAAGFLLRGMNSTSANMSKRHKGLQVHPYMEMIPGRMGQPGGRESEIVPAPDLDLSRPEKEDPQRA